MRHSPVRLKNKKLLTAKTRLLSCQEVTICMKVSIEADHAVSMGSDALNLAHLNGSLPLVFLGYRELNAVAFGQTAEALRDDRAVMNKHIIARIPGDESVPLLIVKPLDNPGFASVLAHGYKIPPLQEKMTMPQRIR
jgi:hypothetical protein